MNSPDTQYGLRTVLPGDQPGRPANHGGLRQPRQLSGDYLFGYQGVSGEFEFP